MKTKIILTCEHADFKIPDFIKNKKRINLRTLSSHKGWDQGAFSVCKILQKQLGAELHSFSYSRLLIDANRSLENNETIISNNDCSYSENKLLIKEYSHYRNKVFAAVKKNMKNKIPTFIFSIHSFTPIFNGKVRQTDIGLLFRPKIKKELSLAKQLRKEILTLTNLKTHFNRPYRGFTDCFSNDILDSQLNNKILNGLFIELNQRILKTTLQRKKIAETLAHSFATLK